MKPEPYPMGHKLELRQLPGQPPVIEGYAAVFDELSDDLGGFREKVKRGAFGTSLGRGDDVRALVEHDPARILARSTAGSLELKEDKKGLHVRITPADTTASRDTLENIRSKNLTQMSFGFVTREDLWEHAEAGGIDIRTLIEVDLHDVSVVAWPAYPQSTAQVRSAHQAFKRGRLVLERYHRIVVGVSAG